MIKETNEPPDPKFIAAREALKRQLKALASAPDFPSDEFVSKYLTFDTRTLEAKMTAATTVVDMIAEWRTYDREISEFFGYGSLLVDLPYRQLERRCRFFFSLKNQTLVAIFKLIDRYLACFGISLEAKKQPKARRKKTNQTS